MATHDSFRPKEMERRSWLHALGPRAAECSLLVLSPLAAPPLPPSWDYHPAVLSHVKCDCLSDLDWGGNKGSPEASPSGLAERNVLH